MSAENVEFIRGLATGAGSLPKEQMLAALPTLVAEACDPEIEFVETPERVDARTYTGHEGVVEAWSRWLDQWDTHSFEVDEIEDHGEQALAVFQEKGRGAGSGAEVASTLYAVFTFRDGKVLRYEEFYDGTAARSALER